MNLSRRGVVVRAEEKNARSVTFHREYAAFGADLTMESQYIKFKLQQKGNVRQKRQVDK